MYSSLLVIRREDGYPRTPYNLPVSINNGDDHEKQTRQELRWLKDRYQMQLRELRYKRLGALPDELEKGKQEPHSAKPRIGKTVLPIPNPRKKLSSFLTPGLNEIESPDSNNPTFKHFSALSESCVGPESLITKKNFYQEGLRPHYLHRTTSLPVDVVDC